MEFDNCSRYMVLLYNPSTKYFNSILFVEMELYLGIPTVPGCLAQMNPSSGLW